MGYPRPWARLAACAASLALVVVPASRAEEPKGTHKHYEEPAEARKPGPNGELAPRLLNLGDRVFTVTTKSKKAQLFVNQGVNLAYAFNHAEAAADRLAEIGIAPCRERV